MSLTTWLLFVAVAAISILSPGPAFMVAIRNGMSGGVRRVAVSSLGNIIGLLVVAGTAVLGLGVVLETSEWLFTALKLFGAGYWIYLGIRQWRNRTGIIVASSAAPARRVLWINRLIGSAFVGLGVS